MGWEVQTPKPCEHPGKPKLPSPYSNEHMIGDVWKCDTCGARFDVRKGTKTQYDQREGDYSVSILEFREIPAPSYSTDPRDHVVDPNYRPGR